MKYIQKIHIKNNLINKWKTILKTMEHLTKM